MLKTKILKGGALKLFQLVCWSACQHLAFAQPLPVSAPAGTNQFAPLTLAWEASASTNVTGYAIYWGRATDHYTNRVDVGNVLQATIENVGRPVYAVAVAVDGAGNESLFSNEAGVRVDRETRVRAQVSPSASGPFTNAWLVSAQTNAAGNQFYRLAIEQTNRTVTWP